MRFLLAAFLFVLLSQQVWANPPDATYDRVMKTNTLRCGYQIWPPVIMKDANTGKMSGFAYDIVESMAKGLGWRVDWAAEVGPGDVVPALETNKIDAYCLFLFETPARAKVLNFVGSAGYAAVYPYVRADETRIKTIGDINQPGITISTMEGEGASALAHMFFDKAKYIELPQTANASDLFVNVTTKKADVVMSDVFTAGGFLDANKGTLKLATKDPIGTFPFSFAVEKGQDKLANTLNQALHIMISTGELVHYYQKYDLPADVHPPAKPY